MSEFQKDVQRWLKLPLTMLGRSAIFKMISLPKLLYVLQNTYYLIPQYIFPKIEGEVRKLIWKQGHPRIAIRSLYRNQYNGGIAMPDVKAYYLAGHLITINEWCHAPWDHPTYILERHSMGKRSFSHYLYSGKGTARLLPAAQVVIPAWIQATRNMGWTRKITYMTPLWMGN